MSTAPDNEEPAPAAAASRRRASGSATLLGWVVRAVGIGALKREAAASAKNAGIRFGLKAVAALLWLLVIGFLFGAFVVWLAGAVGGILACIIIAAAFAVIAVVLHIIGAAMARRRHTWKFKNQFPGLAEAIDSGTLNETAIGALAVAALAGLVLGMRSKR